MNEIQYIEPQQEKMLFSDVCQIIDGARGRMATYANTEACLTNWYVGKRIKEDVLYNKRAEYGKQIIKNLSVKLSERYGSGWGAEKLKHCVRSAYTFSEEEIAYTRFLSPCAHKGKRFCECHTQGSLVHGITPCLAPCDDVC